MMHCRYKKLNGCLLLIVGSMSTVSLANDEGSIDSIAPQDHSLESYQNIDKVVEPIEKIKLATNLPSESKNPKLSKQESKAYLKQNPEEFEKLLSVLLVQGNAESLIELLPIYQQVPNYDLSVIDWGNAIIAAKAGNLDTAINLYRKINAQLPNVNILRFQMAMALFYNQQFEAAKSEFEKLRSSTESTEDIKEINKYLDAISKQESWNFYGSLSYLDDRNITNSPKQGTTLEGDDDSTITATAPRESGKGLNYYVSGDKKWQSDNKFFTALHLNSYGKYYWDNKNYNDLTAGIGIGVGYKHAATEIEIGSFYNNRWYGQGNSGDGDLHTYADTIGIIANLNQWLNPQFKYQGLIRYGKTSYIEQYDHNDGKDLYLSNTGIYFPNGQQYWIFGLDYSNKNAEIDSSSFNRKGLRLGWGQTWPKGYSTKFNIGYAQRDYDAEDFFGIKRENEEYSAGVSFWKRDFSIFSLTPRLELDYYKVDSNSPFEEYDKTNVSVELTKSF